MQIKNLWDQAASTKVHLAKIVAGAQGWDVHDVKASELLGPQIHVYGYDLLTHNAWMGSLNAERFNLLAKQSMNHPEHWNDVRSVLGQLIGTLAMGRTFDEATRKTLAAANLAPEQALATAMTAYFGTTKTFASVAPVPENAHCVILNYRASNDSMQSNLRPAMIPAGAEGPLKVSALLELVTHIAVRDKQVFPEWFSLPG